MPDIRAAHPYYMYDSIRQQPDLIRQLFATQGSALDRAAEAAAARARIVLAGIGTSLHAAQGGACFLRHLSDGRIAPLVEQSFELVNFPLALGHDDALIVCSHRGWKNFSVEAVRKARAAGALTIVITGRNGGDGIRTADIVIETCEQEDSFAHTKSYTTALAALAAMAIGIAERRDVLHDAAVARKALAQIPEWMEKALSCEPLARDAARQIARRQRWIFTGAGPNWPVAAEGALKVRETSYIGAEGIETEQILHGPLAEMGTETALTALVAGGPGDDRMAQVVRAAGELGVLRTVIAADGTPAGPCEHRIEIPRVDEWLSPFLQIVPVQFLSYFVALERGTHPDTGHEDDPAHARAKQHFKL